MKDQTILIKGKPTIKNILQFLVHTIGIALLFFFLSVYLLIVLYNLKNIYGDQQAVLLLSLRKSIIPAISFFFLFFSILSFREYRFAKKRATQNMEIFTIINEEGLSTQKKCSKEIVAWSSLLKVKETKDLFILRHSSLKWSFIPKHYFQTEEDLALFKKMIEVYYIQRSPESSMEIERRLEDTYFSDIDNQKSNIIARGTATFKEYDQSASVIRRKTLMIYVLLVIVVLAFIFKNTFFGTNAQSSFSMLIFAAIMAVFVAIGTSLLFLLLKYRARKEYKSDPLTKKQQLYVINDEGIAYAPGGSYVQFHWDDFRKVQEYKNILILTILPQRFILIPFRLFESTEDIEATKEIIKRKVDSKKIKLKN